MKALFQLLWWGIVTSQAALAAGPVHSPEVLPMVHEQVVATYQAGQRPVVIFDLDDTLINTRERNVRIVREFGKQADIKSRFPWEAAKARRLKVSEMKYAVVDTLKAKGIENAEFLQLAQDFWKARFFTDAYCALDVPNRGAVEYANEIYYAGATIVYLTGRDRPGMGVGTESNLRMLGIPLDGTRAILMMKPTFQMDDLEFKRQALADIELMGVVVAAFENEPANINLLHAKFPGAISVFLDTIHSPRPDVPDQGVLWVKDFVYEQPMKQAI